MKRIDTPIKEYAEGLDVGILLNVEVDSGIKPCQHVQEGRLPRAVHALNEGGFNHTIVCLDCLLEWTETHKALID